MDKSFGKGKIGIEGKNSALYSFSPASPNKEIPRRFNITTHKEVLIHIYTDTFFAKQKYIIGNTYYQIFTDRDGFIYVHSM